MPDATLEKIVSSLHATMQLYRTARAGGSSQEIIVAADKLHSLGYELNNWLAEHGMLSAELASQVPWVGYVDQQGM